MGDQQLRQVRMQEIGPRRVGVYSYIQPGHGHVTSEAFWIDDSGAWTVEKFEDAEQAVDRALSIIIKHMTLECLT